MASAEDELLPVKVIALLEEPTMNSPVVILHESESNKVLPIWIGEPEARAIALAFQDVEVARPLTHTLLANVIESLEADLIEVAIDKMDAGTFYASLFLEVGEANPLVIDARPSDAIAIAIEMGAPIYVAKSVMDAAGQDNPFPEDPGDIPLGLPRGESGALLPVGSEPLQRQDFPAQAKVKFSEEEVSRLQKMLERARAKEAGQNGENGQASGDT